MKVDTILTSAAGLAGTTVISSAELSDITTTIVQILIGIITLVQLLKPKKNGNEKQNP